MMGFINTILNAILSFTEWMWNFPLLIILIGGGIAITIACDFVQVKRFKFMLKKTFGSQRKSKSAGKVSGLQTMLATLANTIGTGNIVGVGSAIAIGGPGSVFWMWVVGFIAMALKYAEVALGVATRTKGKDDRWKGGANRYLSMVWKPLGVIWAVAMLISMAIACGIHTGAVVDAASVFHIPNLVTTIIFTVIIIFVILGGIKALVKITDKMVPIMALIYVLSGLLIIFLNIQNLGPTIASIFIDAFTGTSAVRGFAGATVGTAISIGCARGVYSNDGGNGSASILHVQADEGEPVEQGMYGIFEAFACTIVICTFTALVVLCTGRWQSGDPGSVLAINAFGTIGPVGQVIAAVSLILFAASSALSLATSSGILAKDMFGKVARVIVQVLCVCGCFIGGTVGVDAALPWADVCNMILIITNVGGTMFMLPKLRDITVEYFGSGKDKLIMQRKRAEKVAK